MTITSREILCGITYSQIVACAGMNQKEAAVKLGVNYCYFNEVVKRLGMGHWFTYTRPTRITPEDVKQVASEGYTQYDAAFLLGMSYQRFWELVKRWKLRHLFPTQGKASLLGRNGYAN